MKIITILLLIASSSFCAAQKGATQKLETTTVIYEVDPVFGSRIFQKWLADNDWDAEKNSLTPRVGIKGLVTALGIFVEAGEVVAIKQSEGKVVLFAVLTEENQTRFRKGYRSLMEVDVKLVSEKEFQGFIAEREKEEQEGIEDPFAKSTSE